MARLGRFGWGVRKAFMDKSNEQIYGGLPAGTDIGAAADRVGKQRLAEQLSGTTDRKSRKYRNARDYISRHLGGRRRSVSPEFQGRVSKVLQGERRRDLSRTGMRVEVVADVKVSSKVWKRGRMTANFDPAQTAEYLDALERGDGREAMSMIMTEYGMKAETVSSIPDIYSVTYTE